MSQPAPHAPGGRGLLLFALAVAALLMLWMLFTGSTARDEWIVGAGAVALSALFLWWIYRVEHQRYDLRWPDLLAAWRIPGYMVTDLWAITVVLFKDLLGLERAPSLYRVCGFRTARHDPLMVTRRALATAYTTMTPNSIVIGVDYAQSRMLFHQVSRSDVPKMTRALGAVVSDDPAAHQGRWQSGRGGEAPQ